MIKRNLLAARRRGNQYYCSPDAAQAVPEGVRVERTTGPGSGQDASVTAREAERRRQLLVAFESSPIGTAVTTDAGELVHANPALAELLGVPVQALLGRRLEDLAPPDVAPALTAGREQMLAEDSRRHVADTQLRRADGSTVPVTLTCARVPADAQGDACLVLHVQDASERQAVEAELTRRWLHDPLTGLPNRVLLLDRLTHALARLDRHPSSVAVLFVDLDGFKQVNDSTGHGVGDQVLIAIAKRLRALQRATDTACRLGGDEFVVLCEDSGREQANRVAARIQAALTAPIDWVQVQSDPGQALQTTGHVRLTASIGIALTSQATSDPAGAAHQLLAAADRAMYTAKQRQPKADLPARPQHVVMQFACGNVVPGCRRTFRGTQQQILIDVAAHAQHDHGLSELPDGLVRQVLQHMTVAA